VQLLVLTPAEGVGYHLQGGHLIEQSAATRTLALAEMADFKKEGLLDDPDIVNLDALVAKVHAGLEDSDEIEGSVQMFTPRRSSADLAQAAETIATS
jgi:hypothetical protein